jgi:hypothetical protein
LPGDRFVIAVMDAKLTSQRFAVHPSFATLMSLVLPPDRVLIADVRCCGAWWAA